MGQDKLEEMAEEFCQALDAEFGKTNVIVYVDAEDQTDTQLLKIHTCGPAYLLAAAEMCISQLHAFVSKEAYIHFRDRFIREIFKIGKDTEQAT